MNPCTRQYARAGGSLAHRLYAGVNWRKLRREELGADRDADGVYLCSGEDERRLPDVIPGPEPPSFPTRRVRISMDNRRRPHPPSPVTLGAS
jgi:polysaccharide biosynthesis protein PslH